MKLALGVVSGEFPQGCAAFRKISANVSAEEAGMKDDLGMQDVQYSLVGHGSTHW